MREDQLKRIVEDVVRTMANKGYLNEGACGCAPSAGSPYRPFSEGSSRVTVGTAGKVFSDGKGFQKSLGRAFQFLFFDEVFKGEHAFIDVADGFVSQGIEGGHRRCHAVAEGETLVDG